jgi:ribose transport system permease protein
MPPEATTARSAGHADISEVTGIAEKSLLQKVVASQPFWVTVALIVLSVAIGLYQPSFFTPLNIANITRNFAPFGIMALGMTCVIITGGIDLSIGSIMGLVAIVAGLFLTWDYSWYTAFFMGIVAGLACGAVNGFFIAYIGMSPFVVTLGMM